MFTGAPCTVTEDGIPEKDCVFIADKDSSATASLMGQQNVLKVYTYKYIYIYYSSFNLVKHTFPILNR